MTIRWLLTFLFLLPTIYTFEVSAGTVRYFDKDGNEITEQVNRQKNRKTAESASSQPSDTAPVKPDAGTETSGADPEDNDSRTDYERTFSLEAETILRGFERDTVEKNDVLVVPIYQYLQLDYGKPEGDGLSFHFNGWGRKDLGDGDFFIDDPEAALLYAYMEYVHPEVDVQTRLGRQMIFSGQTSDSVDGLWMGAALAPWIGFSGYGGLPVALKDADGRSGDFTYGGRVFHRWDARYEIGVSYKAISGDQGEDEERLGGDLFFSFPGNVLLTGFSSYNLITRGWAEHSYELTFNLADLYVKPYYQRFSYADFFTPGSISAQPFRFLAETGETLSVIGGELTWRRFGGLNIGARYNYYGYELRQETANYYGGLLDVPFGAFRSGAELGRMDGDTPENSYLLSRAWFYWNRSSGLLANGFFTGDVVYVVYDEVIFNKDASFFSSLGIGRRFFADRLEMRFSGDYSSDPFFDSDLRLMLTALIFL